MKEHYVQGIVDLERDKAGQNVTQSRYNRPVDTAKILRYFLWQEFELSRAATGWIPACKDYETKLKLGRFAYLHIRHVKFIHERISELPGGLGEEKSPELLREAFERISTAPSEAAFLSAYRLFYSNLVAEYEQFLASADPVLNAPTVDQLRYVLMDRSDILEWLNDKIRFTGLDVQQGRIADEWTGYAAKVLTVFRNTHHGISTPVFPQPPDYEAAGPIPATPVMDEKRFPPLESDGAQTQAYSDNGMSPLFHTVRQMVYINATEIAPAETMTYLYYSVQNMPLAFYYDFARHLWDELRHSEMGVRRLKQFGFGTEDFKWLLSSTLNEDSETRYADMYAWLTMVAEACSFTKKRKAVEAFWKFGDEMSAIQSEFDIVDERLHVDFGTKWGPELYKQVGDMITPQVMAERARRRRLEELQVVQPDEIEKLAKNFPAFCGLHTNTLEYGKY